MRRAIPLAMLTFVLACAPLAAARPVVLTPKWRLVAGSKYASVVANDRYVAMSSQSTGSVTLIDDRTGKRTTLSSPGCSSNSVGPYPGPLFGGPWLMAGCGLYNLDSGQWTQFAVSPQCPSDEECAPVAVGRYWVKIGAVTVSGDYGEQSYDLQNISTGQFINDPATPGGTVYDDLNAPSGSSPLCPPLRYPASQRRDGSPVIGTLNFYGSGPKRFALASGNGPIRLLRCGSNLNLPAGLIVGSRAAFFGGGDGMLYGRLLPGMQRFGLQATPPPGQENPASAVAVTARSIYVEAENSFLYSAPIPTALQISACARYQHTRRRRRTRTNPCRYNG